MQDLRLRFRGTLHSNRMQLGLTSGETGGCRPIMIGKNYLITVTWCRRRTITGQGWQEKCLPQRLTGTPYSFLPPVTAPIRPCTKQARTAAIGRLRGTGPTTLGAWTSIPGTSTWTTTTGAMGTRCEGCASEFFFIKKLILRDYRGCRGIPFFCVFMEIINIYILLFAKIIERRYAKCHSQINKKTSCCNNCKIFIITVFCRIFKPPGPLFWLGGYNYTLEGTKSLIAKIWKSGRVFG